MASSDDVQTLQQLYRDLWDCSLKKDAEGLRALFAPGYELIHMTGMHQTAEEYVQAVLDGTLNYYSASHDSIEVRLEPDGERAHIQGRTRTVAAVFGGGRHAWRLQQDLVAIRRDGQWKLLQSRASTY